MNLYDLPELMELLRESGLSPTERLVLLGIADCQMKGRTTAAVEGIMPVTGLSDWAVHTNRKSLVLAGIVTATRTHGHAPFTLTVNLEALRERVEHRRQAALAAKRAA